MDAILDTIDQALRQKGLSDAAASKLAVGHASLIKNLRMPRDGEKRYNLPALMKLAEVLDLEFYFGPKRPLVQVSGTAGNQDPGEDAPSGFLTIPWHAAGPGAGSAPVAFSRAWLNRHHLVPDFLQAVAPDRFALPAPPRPDSIVLIDTRIGQRSGVGLWCFRDAGRMTVARVTFGGEMAVIHPVDPDDAARIVAVPSSTSLGLIGKVVWLGQIVPVKGSVA